MTRAASIARAVAALDDGSFAATLARRVSMPTASRIAACRPHLWAYAEDELKPLFARLGFATRVYEHESAPGPFLLAERIEDPGFTTILQYGHGDVVAGLDEQWSPGLAPFSMTERDGRWYGRGTADNKGQHSVNLTALEAVLSVRGKLGFNCKYLIEMGEESGSPGPRRHLRGPRRRHGCRPLHRL